MSRRSLSTMLVVMVALWGVGLPRFVHVMTAHAPGKATLVAQAETRPASRCTSNCCAIHTHANAEESPEEALHVESEGCPPGCNHSLYCNICELLATLLTSVPALPIACLEWEPIVQFTVDAPTAIAPAGQFDPHAPRGPPARA